MGRKSLKELRQKEIIKAFYKLAKKDGLENASIAKTAFSINVNPSLIMHYFPTKEMLIYGLVEYILDKYLLIFKVDKSIEVDPLNTLMKTIDNIFSKKWNTFFDDGVSYSCYALCFRDKLVRQKFKSVLDSLRLKLEQLIVRCLNAKVLDVENPSEVADLIFLFSDGAYYFLSVADNKLEYEQKLDKYKEQAVALLNIKH